MIGPIVQLALKDMRLLVRDKLGAFFTFAFPILYALLFGLMFAGATEGPSAVPLAIVDLDGSAGSGAFIDEIEDSGMISVLWPADEADGRRLVRRGKAAAVVILEPGFGDPAESMLAGDRITLRGTVDPSRRPETAVLRGAMQAALLSRTARLLQDPEAAQVAIDRARVSADDSENAFAAGLLAGLDAALAAAPGSVADAAEGLSEGPLGLDLEDLSAAERRTPATAFALTFAQGAAWGLMACALGSSLSLVGERNSGTLVRLTLAPVHRWQILAGKAVACFLTSMLMLCVLAAFFHLPFFGVRMSSYPLLAAAMAASSFAFVGVMMFVAVSGRTVAAVEGFGRAVLLVLALAGGAAVPVFFMPGWMQSVAGVSPFRWVIEALDGAVWRGFGPAEMLLPVSVLVGIGLIGFAVGAAAFRHGRAIDG
ncbi:MAG: ABC transporter permease [Planctomycetota bacterium]